MDNNKRNVIIGVGAVASLIVVTVGYVVVNIARSVSDCKDK